MLSGTSTPEIFVASQALFAISFNKSHRLECLGVAVLVLVDDMLMILVSEPGIKPVPLAVEVQSLNH